MNLGFKGDASPWHAVKPFSLCLRFRNQDYVYLLLDSCTLCEGSSLGRGALRAVWMAQALGVFGQKIETIFNHQGIVKIFHLINALGLRYILTLSQK